MSRRTAAVRSSTEAKLLRRMAWRVMIEEKASTLGQLVDVGGEVQPVVQHQPESADRRPSTTGERASQLN